MSKALTAAADLAIALDPALMLEQAGIAPDAWQRRVLQSTALQRLLLCSRQSGKSTVAAGLGLHAALYQPGALVQIASPSERQSKLLFRSLVRL